MVPDGQRQPDGPTDVATATVDAQAGAGDPAIQVADAVDPLDFGSVPGSPARSLGATATVDCEIWSTDFRDRLPDGDPLRDGYDSSQTPADGSRESIERLEKLHRASITFTEIAR